MPAVAAPLLWPIVVEAAKATAAVVGAAVSVIAIDEVVEAIDEALDKRAQERPGSAAGTVDDTCVESCGQKKCPSCNPPPPAGTKRVTRVDWDHTHWPCINKNEGHAHLVKRNQALYPKCDCYWNKPKKGYDVECVKPGEPLPYPML